MTTIHDAALDAATRALWKAERVTPWNDGDPYVKQSVRNVAGAILLAARPALVAELEAENARLREVLRDMLAQGAGEGKSCGHNYYCVCPSDAARAALATAPDGRK